MKKLSRDEMKKVMGGSVPQSGCYAKCCADQDPGWCATHTYAIGIITVSSCSVENVCVGGSLMACSCITGPLP